MEVTDSQLQKALPTMGYRSPQEKQRLLEDIDTLIAQGQQMIHSVPFWEQAAKALDDEVNKRNKAKAHQPRRLLADPMAGIPIRDHMTQNVPYMSEAIKAVEDALRGTARTVNVYSTTAGGSPVLLQNSPHDDDDSDEEFDVDAMVVIKKPQQQPHRLLALQPQQQRDDKYWQRQRMMGEEAVNQKYMETINSLGSDTASASPNALHAQNINAYNDEEEENVQERQILEKIAGVARLRQVRVTKEFLPHPRNRNIRHGSITPVSASVYSVTGQASVGGNTSATPFLSGTMIIVVRKNHEASATATNAAEVPSSSVILVNSFRLTPSGLQELEALGIVQHIVRLGNHGGTDDLFYHKRYGARVWTIADKMDNDAATATPMDIHSHNVPPNPFEIVRIATQAMEEISAKDIAIAAEKARAVAKEAQEKARAAAKQAAEAEAKVRFVKEEKARAERAAAEEKARAERALADEKARAERAAAQEKARAERAEAQEKARAERAVAQEKARLERAAAAKEGRALAEKDAAAKEKEVVLSKEITSPTQLTPVQEEKKSVIDKNDSEAQVITEKETMTNKLDIILEESKHQAVEEITGRSILDTTTTTTTAAAAAAASPTESDDKKKITALQVEEVLSPYLSPPLEETSEVIRIDVRVISCRDLLPGPGDAVFPFVETWIGNSVAHRTKTLPEDTLNPVFTSASRATFSLYTTATEIVAKDGISFHVKDLSLMGEENDELGFLKIPIETLHTFGSSSREFDLTAPRWKQREAKRRGRHGTGSINIQCTPNDVNPGSLALVTQSIALRKALARGKYEASKAQLNNLMEESSRVEKNDGSSLGKGVGMFFNALFS